MTELLTVLPIILLDSAGFLLIGLGIGLAHSETLPPEKGFLLAQLGGVALFLSLMYLQLLVFRRAGFLAGAFACALTLGLVAFAVTQTPLWKLPWINDISTDVESPPPIAGEPPLPPPFVPLHKQYYADLAPLTIARPPADVLKKVEEVLKQLPNLEQIRTDAARGLVLAVEVTPLMRFRDDFTVRVKADGAGSRVDVRSRSRVGKSDLGANGARIRRVQAAIKAALS